MNMKKQLAMLLLVLLSLPAMAFDNDDYLKYVQKVKEEVWGKDLPQFNNRTVRPGTRTSRPWSWLSTRS